MPTVTGVPTRLSGVTARSRSHSTRRAADVGDGPFGLYVHVPFCATRCGYCDFNTYTAGELGTLGVAAVVAGGLATRTRIGAARDAACAAAGRRRCSSAVARRRCSAVTGWPTFSMRVRASFGLAAGAEVTTESNPESTSPEFFDRTPRRAGFTRISLGMQSAASHVLRDPRPHPHSGPRRWPPRRRRAQPVSSTSIST